MVFKPFKPPLIRKSPQEGSNSHATEKDLPPPKKQRLSENDKHLTATQRERKPLLPLKNQNSPEGDHVGDNDSVEKYYNVLWFVDIQFTPGIHLTRGWQA